MPAQPPSSAGSTAISGLKWSWASHALRQIIGLGATAALSRLLPPADFGLLTMAWVFIGFSAILTDSGVIVALVRKDVEREILDAIFWTTTLIGLGFSILIFAAAPISSAYFNEPKVEPLLRILAILSLMFGASALPRALLSRQLAFKTIGVIDNISTFSGAVFGVGFALKGYGVWSLAAQVAATTTTYTVLVWSSCSWRPGLSVRLVNIRLVASEMSQVTAFHILNYFARNADNVIVGSLLGARELGYYTLAYKLMFYPVLSVSSVAGRVMLPFYTHIRDDVARHGRVYLELIGGIALITAPLMLGLCALARPFIAMALGPQWEPAVLPVMILAPLGLLQAIGTTVWTIYQTRSKTGSMMVIGTLSVSLYIFAFMIGAKWGIVGVSIAYASANLILIYPQWSPALRLLKLTPSDVWNNLRTPVLCASIMGIIIFILQTQISERLSPLATVSLLAPLGACVYLITCAALGRDQMARNLRALGWKTVATERAR